MLSDPSVTILMYFVLPVWFIAGFADWICHRATSIETTSGVKESAIHALMFVEVGLILLPGLFLEINSLVIALAIAIFVIHEATALWDISYAVSERHVSPYEQMVHIGAGASRVMFGSRLIFGSGPQVITRYNNYRVIPIQGGPSPGTSSGTALAAMAQVSNMSLSAAMNECLNPPQILDPDCSQS